MSDRPVRGPAHCTFHFFPYPRFPWGYPNPGGADAASDAEAISNDARVSRLDEPRDPEKAPGGKPGTYRVPRGKKFRANNATTASS
jgi:hypothetical protein